MTKGGSEYENGERRMTNEEWQALSTPEVAAMVRERGPRTAVFAAGGTTRHFLLRYLTGWPADMSYWQGYLDEGGRRFLEIARLFFDHGIHTLFTHAIVPGQLEGKGASYVPLALSSGMERIAGSREFLDFYQAYGVKVRFFGNYRQVLGSAAVAAQGGAETLGRFDELMARTHTCDEHLLYWGFNSEPDVMTPILEAAVEFYRERGRSPRREELVERVYGEPVEPVDVYVSFNRPRIANLMPPLLDERADLYFTVGLSFDFSQRVLRSILYDHLIARQGWHRNYAELPASAFVQMKAFYDLNREGVLGVGRRYEAGDMWHALPQVRLPDGWED